LKELLKGCIDLHLHAGPSITQREVDAGEMMDAALYYGYRAYVLKDHTCQTVMSASLIEKHTGRGKVRVFGGLALNNAAGGFNLKAVEIACEMGAKFICLPTVSAANHIARHAGNFPGAVKMEVPEEPMSVLDQSGELLPEVLAIIQYISRHPHLILATGHISVPEVDAVVRSARLSGVRKIYINHPYYTVGATVGEMAEWVKLGAYIELNACLLVPESNIFSTGFDIVKSILERVPIEQLVVCSDLGQKGNIHPALGLSRLMEMLIQDAGLSEAEIGMMARETPAKLLDLE